MACEDRAQCCRRGGPAGGSESCFPGGGESSLSTTTGLRFNSKMGENEGRGDAGGLSRRLVDDNHPVHALLFHFCILLHTSSPSSAPLALHRWLDALLRRFRDEGGGKE